MSPYPTTPLRRAAACAALALAACADDRLTAPESPAAPPSALAASGPRLALHASVVAPELPRAYVNTAWVPPTGRRLVVPADGSLQRAIDTAQAGDVILLTPDVAYVGNFVLRKKTAPAQLGRSPWIVIMTNGPIPAAGTRVTPTTAAKFARIVSLNGGAAVATAAGAHHYRLTGVEITHPTGWSSGGLVNFGDGTEGQDRPDEIPSDLILDRAWVHGWTTKNLKRCVALNSARSAVIDSYLAECHSDYQDSQAIVGWNGPGPYKIVNNYLEGAGENIMFGGATPTVPNVFPQDIEIRRNYIYKPLEWKDRWVVKNHLELKVGRRVLVEGNVFENNWVDGQTGFSILLKTNNGPAFRWAFTSDVTFRLNVVRNVASGVNIAGKDDINVDNTRNILFYQNLFVGVGRSNGTWNGRAIQIASENGVANLAFVHNTILPNTSSGLTIVLDGHERGQNLTITDNVLVRQAYGLKGDSQAEGTPSLAAYWTKYAFTNNVFVGARASLYPPGNFMPDELSDVGFADMASGNYRIASGSKYRGAGSDGANPGAIMDAVLPAVAGVAVR